MLSGAPGEIAREVRKVRRTPVSCREYGCGNAVHTRNCYPRVKARLGKFQIRHYGLTHAELYPHA